MPSLGSDMESGKLVEWLVKPGERVARGDVVAVVETQKGAIEIETFEEGTVSELTAELGQTLPVGAPLAIILGEGEPAPGAEDLPATQPAAEPAPEPKAAREEAPAPEPRPATPPARLEGAPGSPGGDRRAISPAARAFAREKGIDPASVAGSGSGGAILLADVEAAAAGAGAGEGATTARKGPDMAEMRKAIAAAMSRSKRTIPHFYLSHTIDIEELASFLEARNAEVSPAERILLGAAVVRATVVAATRAPELNGHYDDETGFTPASSVNAGVAVALRGGGLVAPALMKAESLDLAATMRGMRDLVTRARAGRLRNAEMTQGTITVSALGESGAEAMSGVIFPPQVALVGIGAPQLRPWVVGEDIVPRRTLTLTVSVDHRVVDGRGANRFVSTFEEAIQSPEEL